MISRSSQAGIAQGRRRPTLLAPREGGRIMELGMFVSWVVVGLLAGSLGGFVMKGGGYGLIGDLGLGLIGGVVGGWIALGGSAGGGIFPAAFAAFVGAVFVVIRRRRALHTGRLGL